jgi:RecB family endonuclease NucS
MKHDAFVNELYSNPGKIEKNFKVLFKEYSFGRGRIDIIGKDKNGNLCLVEVKMKNSEINSAKNQIRRYRSQLLRFLEIISVSLNIRAIIVTPFEVVDLGTKKVDTAYMMQELPRDIPTSQEIFGLRHEE